MALVPGLSRSGATICAGLFLGVKREDAARFAFLLSAPIIAGAASSQIPGVVQDFVDGKFGWDEFAFFATGFVVLRGRRLLVDRGSCCGISRRTA